MIRRPELPSESAQIGAPETPTCQRSVNCIRKTAPKRLNASPYSYRNSVAHQANKLEWRIRETVRLAKERYGISCLAFITFTFRNKTMRAEVATRKARSLFNEIRGRYGNAYLVTMQRGKDGSIHFHALWKMKFDLRAGFDFTVLPDAQRVRDGRRRRAFHCAAALNAENREQLMSEWKYWDDLSKRFAWFGRYELAPVKSIGALGRYLGEQTAQRHWRWDSEPGVRRFRTGREMNFVSSRNSFVEGKAKRWRAGVSRFAANHGCKTEEQMTERLGKRWKYRYRVEIKRLAEASRAEGATTKRFCAQNDS